VNLQRETQYQAEGKAPFLLLTSRRLAFSGSFSDILSYLYSIRYKLSTDACAQTRRPFVLLGILLPLFDFIENRVT
jgi:hypothetical protein